MAENSKIQWTTHTANFWTGCQEVSPACDNCYARDQWAARAGRDFHERIRTTESNRRKPFKWNNQARESEFRAQVFTNSLADFFDNQVPREWRDDACNTMLHCLSLDWLVLTKRPQNAPKMVPAHWLECWPPHIWIGASAGDRKEFDRNVTHLRALPAAIRFLSLEPLLEDLGEIDLTGIHWVIVGGESGAWHKARPCWVPSVRNIVRQCKRQHVPVFVKQLGTNVQDRNDAGFMATTTAGRKWIRSISTPNRGPSSKTIKARLVELSWPIARAAIRPNGQPTCACAKCRCRYDGRPA